MATTEIHAENAEVLFIGAYNCLNNAIIEFSKGHKVMVYEKRDELLGREDCKQDVSGSLLTKLVSKKSDALVREIDLDTMIKNVRTETSQIVEIGKDFYYLRDQISRPYSCKTAADYIIIIDGMAAFDIKSRLSESNNFLRIGDGLGWLENTHVVATKNVSLSYSGQNRLLLDLYSAISRFYETEINSAKEKLVSKLKAEADTKIAEEVDIKYNIKKE